MFKIFILCLCDLCNSNPQIKLCLHFNIIISTAVLYKFFSLSINKFASNWDQKVRKTTFVTSGPGNYI